MATIELGDGVQAVGLHRPTTLDELAEVVRERGGAGTAMFPRGGATALDYGNPPTRPGVALELGGLNRVIDYPAADMTITVEAGLSIAELGRALAAEGQFLPLDVSRPEEATIGGALACNAAGSRRYGWGRPRDQIIGVAFVDARGRVVRGGGRVVKNVAGYDFPKLLTGSLGTLGVIAEVTLKVRPRPEARAMAWRPCRDAEALAAFPRSLNRSATRPTVVDALNRSAAARIAERLGLPFDPARHVGALVVGFEDNADATRWQIDRFREELAGFGPGIADDGVVRNDGDADPLWRELADFPEWIDEELRRAGPLSFTANLKPTAVREFLDALDPDRWLALAHAGNGIVRAHLRGDADADPNRVGAELTALRARALAAGGNLTLPRCPTERKADWKVWGEPRGDWALARLVKSALDPEGLLNPGRFVGGI